MTTQMLKQPHPETVKISTSHFFFHRDRIEKEIAKNLSSFGEKTKLRDACEYALTNGGKRFRPLIVMMVAEALGLDLDVSEAALSVEFFHTASLIADDLPCMDNEEERRGRPTLHKIYGETIALLASYALITAGFEKIAHSTKKLKEIGTPFAETSEKVGMIALECATRCSGILGATGGQFLDLFPPTNSLETVIEIINKKTVTLFEVSFVFGWIFGGGDLERLEMVKKLGYHLGMAFQVVDDINDLSQDDKNGSLGSNIAKLIGRERALALFYKEMDNFLELLEALNLDTPSFAKMADLLKKQAAHPNLRNDH